MAKLLLISILIATIVIPTLCARDPNPQRGLQKALLYMIAYELAYVVFVVFIYPRIF